MNRFTLHIHKSVERQLNRCRASIRKTIGDRLQALVDDLTIRPVASKSAVAEGPPLRFYVWEGYRISYQVNPFTHVVEVLELRAEHG
jgi:mRNA-degrading endonuclease RelE of RelBE toxin-antitoxin system